VTSSTTTELPLHQLASSLDALLSWVRRNVPPGGLSMTARGTMARLVLDGPGRISELARLEGVTQPAMTGLLNRLEADGLVRREPDPADARATLAVITDAGRQLTAERRSERSRLLAAQIARLSESEQASLLAAAPALDRLAALAGG
jgi:DNA-binding MarR family transcriptional regulator